MQAPIRDDRLVKQSLVAVVDMHAKFLPLLLRSIKVLLFCPLPQDLLLVLGLLFSPLIMALVLRADPPLQGDIQRSKQLYMSLVTQPDKGSTNVLTVLALPHGVSRHSRHGKTGLWNSRVEQN